MADRNNWPAFFDAHAPIYEDNVFTKNTLREVDFLVGERSLRPGATILDVGCGTGRHAVELARRGFAATGPDLSVLDTWGGTAGNWGKRTLDLDEFEIMVVARRTGGSSAAGDA